MLFEDESLIDLFVNRLDEVFVNVLVVLSSVNNDASIGLYFLIDGIERRVSDSEYSEFRRDSKREYVLYEFGWICIASGFLIVHCTFDVSANRHSPSGSSFSV